MSERRKTTTPVSVSDLKARIKLLKDNGVTFYNDGLLELHISGKPTVPGKKPGELDKQIDLGQV